MLISHEVPISLLKESLKFNDYDYCLLHLTYKYPEYTKFYIDSIKRGRKVILDNSIIELGNALTNEQLADGVLKLKPTEYIIPDVFNDCKETIRRCESFIAHYPNLPGIKIGVIHGSTINELIECYKYMASRVDKIGIPFGSKAYEELVTGGNIYFRRTIGRQLFIRKLIEERIWVYNKPHHLLGCNLPQEFNSPIYKNLNIESLDTSNPIIAGIDYIKYLPTGLNDRPNIKICDYINSDLSPTQLNCISYNINMFRYMVEH